MRFPNNSESSDTQVLWVLVGNPENRRITEFVAALYRHGQRRILRLSYEALLSSADVFALVTAVLRECRGGRVLVRIDSPGENFAVERQLIAWGARTNAARIDVEEALTLTYDRGRFRYLSEWYLGYAHLLDLLALAFERAAAQLQLDLRYLNRPRDIKTLFDKYACQRVLAGEGVDIPRLLPLMDNGERFLQYLRERRLHRVFIKPRYGSSASGVIALQINPVKGQVRAHSSLELAGKPGGYRLYNSLKVRCYSDLTQVEYLVDQVLREDAYAEVWIPKSRVGGMVYDLRLVVIGGQASQCVLRKSFTPFTNLHLGNRRGDVAELNDGGERMAACASVAQRAANCFAGIGSVGLDILIPRNSRTPRVLELNAFGDLLPGIHHHGRSTYESQVHYCEALFG